MPVNIPAGTKFEAIKPSTVVNRRSALVNSNDQTFTIEDFAQTVGGGTFPITQNNIPKGTALGNLIASQLFENDYGFGPTLFGDFNGGVGFTYQGGANLLSIGENILGNAFGRLGDTTGVLGPLWGVTVESNALSPAIIISTYGYVALEFYPLLGDYKFGGATTRFGIINADVSQASLSVTSDLVINVSGTDYIKVDVNGTLYKIQLIP